MTFDPERYVADARIDAAAAERLRQRATQQQLSVGLGLAQVLADLAERHVPVRIDLVGAPSCQGSISGVGADAVTLIDARRRLNIVAVAQIASVSTAHGFGLSSEAGRADPTLHPDEPVGIHTLISGSLIGLLGQLAEESALVHVRTSAGYGAGTTDPAAGDPGTGGAAGVIESVSEELLLLRSEPTAAGRTTRGTSPFAAVPLRHLCLVTVLAH